MTFNFRLLISNILFTHTTYNHSYIIDHIRRRNKSIFIRSSPKHVLSKWLILLLVDPNCISRSHHQKYLKCFFARILFLYRSDLLIYQKLEWNLLNLVIIYLRFIEISSQFSEVSNALRQLRRILWVLDFPICG